MCKLGGCWAANLRPPATPGQCEQRLASSGAAEGRPLRRGFPPPGPRRSRPGPGRLYRARDAQHAFLAELLDRCSCCARPTPREKAAAQAGGQGRAGRGEASGTKGARPGRTAMGTGGRVVLKILRLMARISSKGLDRLHKPRKERLDWFSGPAHAPQTYLLELTCG